MFISKLGTKQRGGQFAVWGEPLARQKLCAVLVAKNGGKRGEAGGKSQEKVQVTLFFFLETNSGWTLGDARQFTKNPALLFPFSKRCNLETGPQPSPASSTWAALRENLKCLHVPSLTHTRETSGKNNSCYINDNSIASTQLSPCVYSQPSHMAVTRQPSRQSDKALSITSQTASKLCSQIRPYWIFCFISSLEKPHSATSFRGYLQAFIVWAALFF